MNRSMVLLLAALLVIIRVAPVNGLPLDRESVFSCADVSEIPQVECQALVALYNETNGPGWSESTNWVTTPTPSDWFGITVMNGHVTDIVIDNNQLVGAIPIEIGDLSNLLELNLSGNQLEGGIPTSLANLQSLLYLHLGENMLMGTIPHELGNLVNLKEMGLGWNELSGSLPAEIGNISSLNSLTINHNLELAGQLPASLTNLNLREFWFGDTLLCEPGDQVFQDWLSSIIFLQRTGVICPGKFTSCDLVSEIPSTECQALVWLYYSTSGSQWKDNSWWLQSDQPSFWHGVTISSGHVAEIKLPNNQLAGQIPVEMDDLPSLVVLDLSYNQLNGEIPGELGLLASLTYLNLGNNSLSGEIPYKLGDLTNLASLDLGMNQMSGNIPTELCGLTDLTYLNLSYNQLRGTIPVGLGNLVNLQVLSLSNNQLTGGVPPELGYLTHLSQLALSSNQLSGAIPPELGYLTGVLGLYLDRNQLSGSIPAELGSLTTTWVVNLSNNQLSGSIPPELGDLGVWNLYLNDNQLSGSIPPELGNLAAAWVIDLSRNQLSGSIPLKLGDLVNILGLNLSHNQLSGHIPPELGNISGIDSLQLQNNRLEGDVPASFINLKWLCDPSVCDRVGLDLDYNMLAVPSGYPDTNVPLQVFLHQKDPDWHLLQGFTQVIGSAGGVMVSLDGKTQIFVPAGAVITDTVFTYKPWSVPQHSLEAFGFAQNSFELIAMDNDSNPLSTFNLPISVTLSYMNSDLYGIPEGTLGLYYWDGASSTWIDAVTTCPGEYERDPAAHRLALLLCHLTEFGLLGNPIRLYLPQISRWE